MQDFVGDLFLGQANDRATQQRAQGQRVTAVRDRARYSDQVLNFLAVEESLAGLRGDRNVSVFQRPLIEPKAGAGRREEGDVSGSCWPIITKVLVPYRVGPDQALDDVGDESRIPRA